MRKRQTFTWNVAFQSRLTETEQVEGLMGLKEDIKIIKKNLNVVHIKVTDSETVAGHAKLWLKIRSCCCWVDA